MFRGVIFCQFWWHRIKSRCTVVFCSSIHILHCLTYRKYCSRSSIVFMVLIRGNIHAHSGKKQIREKNENCLPIWLPFYPLAFQRASKEQLPELWRILCIKLKVSWRFCMQIRPLVVRPKLRVLSHNAQCFLIGHWKPFSGREYVTLLRKLLKWCLLSFFNRRLRREQTLQLKQLQIRNPKQFWREIHKLGPKQLLNEICKLKRELENGMGWDFAQTIWWTVRSRKRRCRGL